MTLLLDENLSPKLVDILVDEFPGTSHVELLGMRGATDEQLWSFARTHDYVLVSKDNDFRQRVFLHGPPPKVIWLAVGNAGTRAIGALIRQHSERIREFAAHPHDGLLVLSDQPEI